MEYLRSIYPALDERKPLHPLYLPAGYALYAATIFIPGKSARLLITFPLLLLLALGTPFYTAGTISDDYGIACAFLPLLVAFIDYQILTPLEGETVRFVGRAQSQKETKGVSEDDCVTTWEKFKWALRFTTLVRGIGWNIQVKGVPAHPHADSARWPFVRKTMLQVGRSWSYKLLCVFVVGYAIQVGRSADSDVIHSLTDVAVGWFSAAWAYNGIKAIYMFGAACTVAVGVCEPWEWPPIFGSLREAWSVRQMWSAVWHQLMRRQVQKPGQRLASFLGFRRGTLGSKYLQLYVAFAISMAFHLWQNFNAVRVDSGNFRFFGAQPFAITAEDFVQWCWRRYGPSRSNKQLAFAATVVGYVWTFAWFSYCLPPFAKDQMRTGITANGMGDQWALAQGRQAALQPLRL